MLKILLILSAAFFIFVKENRKEAEQELGAGHSKEALKQLLLQKWEAVDLEGGDEATKYIQMAEEDEARYKKEMERYNEQKSKMLANSSSSPEMTDLRVTRQHAWNHKNQ